MRCSEPGVSVAVAIVVSRGPGRYVTSRRTKQKRDAKYFEKARNMRTVGTVLGRLLPEFKSFAPPVVRTHHWGPFSGASDDFDVTFIFATRAEAQTACATELVRLGDRVHAVLLSEGYSADALATFRYDAVSEEEIAEAGGDFAYFH